MKDDALNTDSDKLRFLAKWFDWYDETYRTHTIPQRQVQQYLLDLADRLEKKNDGNETSSKS